ncbi:MAG: hypothetical protein IH899_02175 [Planctomycetes bacterium]|nr:hypothetical protein [Planctomycetota bacterium]
MKQSYRQNWPGAILLVGSLLHQIPSKAAEPPITAALVLRGDLIFDDDGSAPRGGKLTSKLTEHISVRA